ncbi:MAG: sigma-70 family RNA polymerase sigma factor [Gammaproteobacteria bacterium]|nr:sigma-70 family RNA polymerase sigma factor [Gammaproteobacteria bacterium]
MNADTDLIAEHIPRLRRYARALVGDRTRADDLVQDCLTRACERLHLWQPGSDLRAWLFTIMHNLHANDIRRQRSRPDCVPLADNLDAPLPADQEDGLTLRDLQTALAQLPIDQRTVVLLVGLEEMSYAQAAGTLGIPVGTVMSRLARGRERLRVLMSDSSGPALRRVK